jgi:hypothetical protein
MVGGPERNKGRQFELGPSWKFSRKTRQFFRSASREFNNETEASVT